MKTKTLRAMIANRLNRENIYNKADYWNAKAEEYDGDAVSMWPNNHLNAYYHREQMILLNDSLPQLNGMSVLDVGCGTGLATRFLAERGATALGVDFAEKVIEIAKNISPSSNPTYRVQSIFDLDDEEQFDAVVSRGSLTVACSSADQFLDVIQRLSRALKPGGRVLLLEPIHSTFLHRVLKISTHQACTLITQAGLQVTKVTPLHFWPARLVLAYIRWPRFLTSVGYHLGQGLMWILGNHRTLGDYKAIEATKPIASPTR